MISNILNVNDWSRAAMISNIRNFNDESRV